MCGGSADSGSCEQKVTINEANRIHLCFAWLKTWIVQDASRGSVHSCGMLWRTTLCQWVPKERQRLTWEDATERFLDVAELRAKDTPNMLERAVDRCAFAAFNAISGGWASHITDDGQGWCWEGLSKL